MIIVVIKIVILSCDKRTIKKDISMKSVGFRSMGETIQQHQGLIVDHETLVQCTTRTAIQ